MSGKPKRDESTKEIEDKALEYTRRLKASGMSPEEVLGHVYQFLVVMYPEKYGSATKP